MIDRPNSPTSSARTPLELPSPAPLAAPADFQDRLSEIGVSLTPEMVTRLGDYLARLLAMNEAVNLTSITDPVEAWSRHVLDSLTLVPHLKDLPAGASVIDVGSGGGVPGVVLAIARPDLKFTLVDATEKKVAFLTAVTAALGLTSVTARAGRAEKLTGELGKSFDAVTARAVAKIAGLLPWTAPFAKKGGLILLIKGERAAQELSDARTALGRFGCVHERTDLTPTGRVVVLRAR